MKNVEEIISSIRELIVDLKTPSEADFDYISEELESRLSIDIHLRDEIPEGMDMADILSVYSTISWDSEKSMGVSASMTGSEIIEKIRDATSPIDCLENREQNYRDYALAFSQLSERLTALADEVKEYREKKEEKQKNNGGK